MTDDLPFFCFLLQIRLAHQMGRNPAPGESILPLLPQHNSATCGFHLCDAHVNLVVLAEILPKCTQHKSKIQSDTGGLEWKICQFE